MHEATHVLAPPTRNVAPLPPGHPCAGCGVRHRAVCGVLDSEELAKFKGQGRDLRLAAGQPLFHQGDDARRVFTLTTGALKLYKLLPDGRQQITGFIYPGDLLGVSVNDEHAFTAEALEESQLCCFPGARFDDFAERHSDMERELYSLAVHELAAAREQMVLLGRKTAAERLASFFVALAQRTERGSDCSTLLHLPMSRSDIADYLGLRKETISRVLGVLKSERVVRLRALDTIEILDRQRLEDIAAGEASA